MSAVWALGNLSHTVTGSQTASVSVHYTLFLDSTEELVFLSQCVCNSRHPRAHNFINEVILYADTHSITLAL